MSTIFLECNFDGVHVLKSQLSHIFNTTHPSQNILVKLCHDVHYMWWGDQELELQEWKYHIKSKKTIILALIMLVPNNNPPVYK